MESNCKIEHRVRMRMGDGLLLCGVFINLLIMIILGYGIWKPILFYRDIRIVLSLLLILLIVRVLLYFLDIAIWRIFGVELVEINSVGIRYEKRNRLIKQNTFIDIKNVLSIKSHKHSNGIALSNIEEDKGKIQIYFMRRLFYFQFIDYIDCGSQFSDAEVDKFLARYYSIKSDGNQ